MTIVAGTIAARSLISGELFDRLTDRIAVTDDLPHALAERIVDQALAFLCACATERGPGLAPSPLVDLGWHAFILHTEEYTRFCDRVAGRYIHHVPEPERDVSIADRHADLTRAISAIAAAGFPVDPDLWSLRAANCTSGDDGCRASGKDGNQNTDTNGR
ncbi:glycine-rich domain-containing protein [Amycolatopsis sp. lyj-23]|uniref:glycine-rich domain-containing protein n=1 Tax=Amycolatopsis sp. lyj-23 TaxID=2789283 RepID=UPI00397BCE13